MKKAIENLKSSKMNKPDDLLRGEYPDISTIVTMQENAKRLLKMTVGAATEDGAPHSKLVKDELLNIVPPENTSISSMDNRKLKRLVEDLAKRINVNTVANRCLSSFVLADFSGRLPKAFMDSYGLKRIPLSGESTSG